MGFAVLKAHRKVEVESAEKWTQPYTKELLQIYDRMLPIWII